MKRINATQAIKIAGHYDVVNQFEIADKIDQRLFLMLRVAKDYYDENPGFRALLEDIGSDQDLEQLKLYNAIYQDDDFPDGDDILQLEEIAKILSLERSHYSQLYIDALKHPESTSVKELIIIKNKLDDADRSLQEIFEKLNKDDTNN